MERDFNYMESLDIPSSEEFDSQLHLLKKEALELIMEMGLSGDECDSRFALWKKENVRPRPDFSLPRPGVIGGVVTQLSEASLPQE